MTLGRRICFTNFFFPAVKHEEYKVLLSSGTYDGPIQLYACQLEVCPTTNNLHMQGYVEFKSVKSLRWLQQSFLTGAHFEKAVAPRKYGVDYCSKPGGTDFFLYDPNDLMAADEQKKKPDAIDYTEVKAFIQAATNWRDVVNTDNEMVNRALRAKLSWCKEIFAAKPPPVPTVPPLNLYKYQLDLLARLNEDFQKRRIFWVWSEQSGVGKSTLYDIIQANFNDTFVAPVTNMNDATTMYSNERITLFDVPRAFNVREPGFIAYLERISDQSRTSSGKYMGKTVVWNCHVVVFSNSPPPTDLLPGRFVEINAEPVFPEVPFNPLDSIEIEGFDVNDVL